MYEKPNFPEEKNIDVDMDRFYIFKRAEICITSRSSKKDKSVINLFQWEKEVFKQVEEKVSDLRLTSTFKSTVSSVL